MMSAFLKKTGQFVTALFQRQDVERPRDPIAATVNTTADDAIKEASELRQLLREVLDEHGRLRNKRNVRAQK